MLSSLIRIFLFFYFQSHCCVWECYSFFVMPPLHFPTSYGSCWQVCILTCLLGVCPLPPGVLHFIFVEIIFPLCFFSASTSLSLTLRLATIFWEFGMVHLALQTVGSCWKNGLAQPCLKIATRLSTSLLYSLMLIILSANKDFLYSSLVRSSSLSWTHQNMVLN